MLARVNRRDDEFYLTDKMTVFLVCDYSLICFVSQSLTHDMAFLTPHLTPWISVGPEPSFPCPPVPFVPQLPRLQLHVLAAVWR